MLATRHNHSGERKSEQGFTLIELSIVLVIIGLIVGGVLVGQDLIRAAEVRATISQIEKYNTAVNTFRGKFNAIPGDMNAVTASTFGFGSSATTGGTRTTSGAAGQGNGDGVLDGEAGSASLIQGSGETGVFWVDLTSPTAGNLIDGGFTTAVETGNISEGNSNISIIMPAAKLGRGNYIYVFENGGLNYYGMAAPASAAIASGVLTAAASMSVQQAYNIDKKMDDGLPTSGNVMAQIVDASAINWVAGGAAGTFSAYVAGTTAAGSGSSSTCFEGGTSAGGSNYSLDQNNGAGANCALSFKFQ